MSDQQDRRKYLQYAGAAVVGLIIGGIGVYSAAPRTVEKTVEKVVEKTVTKTVTAAAPAASSDAWKDWDGWKQFKGDTLRVATIPSAWHGPDNPGSWGYRANREFTELTGIDLQMEHIGFAELNDRIRVDMVAESGYFDVFSVWHNWFIALDVANGGLESLTPYINDKSLTNPTYNYADFWPASVDNYTVDGQLYHLPHTLEFEHLWYRKDLYDKHGLSAPTSIEQLESNVQTLMKDPDAPEYGYVNNTDAGSGSVHLAWYEIAMKYGFDFFDWDYATKPQPWTKDDLQPVVNSPGAVRALEWDKHMLQEYAPPGWENYDWALSYLSMQEENTSHIALGNWAGATVVAGNPDLAGKIGAVAFPDVETTGGVVQGWTNFMNAHSEAKGPAWLFLQWSTQKELLNDIMAYFGFLSARQSYYPSPWMDDFDGLFNAYEASIAQGISAIPPNKLFPESSEMEDNLMREVQNGLIGAKEPQQALDDAADVMRNLMESAGHYD